MQLTKEQIKIIASYWGAECRYEVLVISDPLNDFTNTTSQEWKLKRDILNGFKLHRIGLFRNFRLILRPLWSITKDELRELVAHLGGISPSAVIGEAIRWVSFRNLIGKHEMICIHPDNSVIFMEPISSTYTKTINFLRSKGFCVDEEIKDFVEWKEVGK